MPAHLIRADQRCRILVTKVDRLWVRPLPKIGYTNEIQAREPRVVSRRSARMASTTSLSGDTVTDAAPFSRQCLHPRRQSVELHCVSAHDGLPLLPREPLDRPSR